MPETARRGSTATKPAVIIQKAFPQLRFYGDEFVFDTVSGMFYRVSSTTSFILHSLQSGIGVDQLPALLSERYGIDRPTAVRDIELFFNDLSALELVGQFHP